MIQKNKKRVILALLSVLILMLSVTLVINMYKTNANAFTDANYQEYYSYGEKIDILDCKLVSDGTEYQTTSFVITPSGNKLQTLKLVLDEVGQYAVEYKANVNGKVYSTVKYFTVRQKLYDFSNATYDKEGDFLRVVFDNSNKEIKFNQPINLKNLNDTVEFVSIDAHMATRSIVGMQSVKIKFTDVYNKENFLVLAMNMHDSMGSLVYLQACGAGQPLKGAYKGEYGSKLYSGGMYGTACGGVINGSMLRTAQFYYNYEEKTVTTPNGIWKGLVCDMDDSSFYSTPWEGFTTGDVYVSISVDSITASECTVDIRNIYGLDFSQNDYVQSFAEPNIEIAFDGYSESDLPTALQGQSYKAFKAVGYNGQITKEILPTVYYGYQDSSEIEIEIDENGCFKTDYCGSYSLVYSIKLPNGEYYDKVCKLSCVEKLPEISMSFDEDVATNIDLGEKYIFPELLVANVSGNYFVTFEIELDNEKFVLEKDYLGLYSYLPIKSGDATINIKVKDFIGREAILSKNITINNVTSEKIVFEPVLPRYLFDGYEFEIPKIKAYNYSTQQYVDVEVFTIDKNGEALNTSGIYTPKVEKSLDKITIKYKTENLTKSYDIPVIKYGVQGEIDMRELFVVDDSITKISTEEKISFVTENDASFEFANKLLAEKFSFAFNVSAEKNYFNRVNVFLTDSEDVSIKIKLTFEKNGSKSRLYINDDSLAYGLSSSFTGESISNFSIVFVNSQSLLQIDGKDIYINKDLNNNEFKGFDSKYLYVSFDFEDVTGTSQLDFFQVGRQVLSSKVDEYIKPYIYIDGSYGGFYQIGEVYNLAKLFVGDAMSTMVDVKYSFTCPDKSNAVSTNGVVIKNVDGSEIYDVILNQEGKYTFSLQATDQNGNLYKYSYSVRVIDSVAPTISTSLKRETTIKQNKTINFKDITVTDESGSAKFKIYVFTPNGIMQVVNESKYEFTELGDYTVCIYAYDENYNAATEMIVVHVVKG